VVVPARLATQPGGIGFLESIHGLLKSFKIRALISFTVWHCRGGGGKALSLWQVVECFVNTDSTQYAGLAVFCSGWI
jgi:hypothetical protein